jgi:hypothetical protein
MLDVIILENSLNRDATDWHTLEAAPWPEGLPRLLIPFKITFFARSLIREEEFTWAELTTG